MKVEYQKTIVDGRERKWNDEKTDFETSQKIVRTSKTKRGNGGQE